MAEFRVVVSDPDTGRSYQQEVDGQDANRFLGKEIGEEVDGSAVGLDGATVQITGGSDVVGRPMREDVAGSNLKKIMVAGGTGFEATREGERKRITVRGREVSDVIAQVNAVVVDAGDTDVEAALGEGGEDGEDEDDE